MKWGIYKRAFTQKARLANKKEEYISQCLIYAKPLFEKNLPIIFNQTHLALLIGIDNEYFHRMSNSSLLFYRSFEIAKKNGGVRRIDEPLPDLKKVQKWILNEILYKIPVSKFSKAYIPKCSIKDNARFHKGQKVLLQIDLKDYFKSIKIGMVTRFYKSIGYNKAVAVMLAKLSCYRGALPQGAPTSPYLSNLITVELDDRLARYALAKHIRYTRYADDLSFSGDFNVEEVIRKVINCTAVLGLSVNTKKTKVSRMHKKQQVTGIVVNEKIQVCRTYREKIRQEVYFINKYGLSEHLARIKETRKNYLEHLIGKINFVKFVNPHDEKMEGYLKLLKDI